MAGTFRDSDRRTALSHMAQACLRLADMAAPEQKRRSIQQQQQQQQQQQAQPEGDAASFSERSHV
jgi:hypothetical protein